MHSFLYYYLIFINCTAFVVYGADKAFAKLHSWRVPEIVLLVLAALGGSARRQRRRIYRHAAFPP